MFRGYIHYNAKTGQWTEDEWLTQIYQNFIDAKNALYEFAEGHPFDNNGETKITRYFGKARGAWDKGKELTKGDPNIVTHEWMRFAEFHLL